MLEVLQEEYSAFSLGRDEIPEHSKLSIKRSKEIRKHLLENKPIKHEEYSPH